MFGSDAISSSAYATEEILLALVVAGSVGLSYSTHVAAAIALLFTIVTISYRQTILAYPTGGGAYTVARENLGLTPALDRGRRAAAGLRADRRREHRRRGGRDRLGFPCARFRTACSCACCASPSSPRSTYAGPKSRARPSRARSTYSSPSWWRWSWSGRSGCSRTAPSLRPCTASLPTEAASSPMLLLLAFASGCAALTGIEAISNGVPAFRTPESRNAAITLLWMAGICIALFLGITVLAQAYHIVPELHGETVLSKLGGPPSEGAACSTSSCRRPPQEC